MAGSILAGFQKLKLRITTEAIEVNFGILTSKKNIRLSDIESISIRQYNALKEFWGYGIRYNSTTDCFTVSGDMGLEITLRSSSRKILISTNREKALRLALEDEVFEGIYKK